MIRLLFLRRFVSSIAIIMLVWCQTCAAMQGVLNAVNMPAAEAVAVTLPCHLTATDSSSDTGQQRDSQTRCQSHDASVESAKFHLPAIDDFPLAVVFTVLPALLKIGAAPNDQAIERATPPPLILVYCRLLI